MLQLGRGGLPFFSNSCEVNKVIGQFLIDILCIEKLKNKIYVWPLAEVGLVI